jgi:hypothetical protein
MENRGEVISTNWGDPRPVFPVRRWSEVKMPGEEDGEDPVGERRAGSPASRRRRIEPTLLGELMHGKRGMPAGRWSLLPSRCSCLACLRAQRREPEAGLDKTQRPAATMQAEHTLEAGPWTLLSPDARRTKAAAPSCILELIRKYEPVKSSDPYAGFVSAALKRSARARPPPPSNGQAA